MTYDEAKTKAVRVPSIVVWIICIVISTLAISLVSGIINLIRYVL